MKSSLSQPQLCSDTSLCIPDNECKRYRESLKVPGTIGSGKSPDLNRGEVGAVVDWLDDDSFGEPGSRTSTTWALVDSLDCLDAEK